MPFNGPEWLSMTDEPPLEPQIPICDAHQHFWDFRTKLKPYDRYLIHELADDLSCGHNVRSTVFIEARSMYRADGPEELRPVGEVEFVQGIAAASASGLYGPTRIAAAIVGHADLKLGARVEPVLEALLAASPNRFRGIRHIVCWNPHPDVADRESEGVLSADGFRTGARVLARMGLSLDIFLYFPQLPELAEFANAVPELTVVMNHLGGLLRIGPYAAAYDEAVAVWKKGIAAVARCPNVVVKLGGLGEIRQGFDFHLRAKPIDSEELAGHMAPLINYCIEEFGPERCMFESNFPMDKLSFSYNVMCNAFKRLTTEYSAGERAAMFHDTAARTYRIDVP